MTFEDEGEGKKWVASRNWSRSYSCELLLEGRWVKTGFYLCSGGEEFDK